MTHDELVMMIKLRYPGPAYAFLPGVRNQTGYSSGPIRTADAIVMSLFPSRGFVIHGFEVKAYRGDWLNELKKPEKAEAIAQFCDFWWVVADKQTVRPEEVPHNWGWLYPRGRVLITGKQPEKLVPKPLKPEFVAAILRNACSWLPGNDAINKAVEIAVSDSAQTLRKKAEAEKSRLQHEINRLAEDIAQFEASSGISIRTWRHEASKVGEAVKFFLNGGLASYERELTVLVDKLQDLSARAAITLSAIGEQKTHGEQA